MNALDTSLDLLFKKSQSIDSLKEKIKDFDKVEPSLKEVLSTYGLHSGPKIKLQSFTDFKNKQIKQIKGRTKVTVLTRESAKDLCEALELTVRLHLKQFECLDEFFRMSELSYIDVKEKKDFDFLMLEDFSNSIKIFKRYAKHSGVPNELGIYNEKLPSAVKDLWICYKSLRQILFLSEPRGVLDFSTVSADEPSLEREDLPCTAFLSKAEHIIFFYKQSLKKDISIAISRWKALLKLQLKGVLAYLTYAPYNFKNLEEDLVNSGLIEVFEKLKIKKDSLLEASGSNSSWDLKIARANELHTSFNGVLALKKEFANFLKDPEYKTLWNSKRNCFEFLVKDKNGSWVIKHSSKNMHAGFLYLSKKEVSKTFIKKEISHDF